MRVVIAEDNIPTRQRLQALARGAGADVVDQVENGWAAIEACRRLTPDLILLDVSMPVMGGFPAAQCLRTALPELRIIFVSQYADPH